MFRRSQTEVAEAQFEHNIAALKAKIKTEIKALEPETSHASGVAKNQLQAWSLAEEALVA